MKDAGTIFIATLIAVTGAFAAYIYTLNLSSTADGTINRIEDNNHTIREGRTGGLVELAAKYCDTTLNSLDRSAMRGEIRKIIAKDSSIVKDLDSITRPAIEAIQNGQDPCK